MSLMVIIPFGQEKRGGAGASIWLLTVIIPFGQESVGEQVPHFWSLMIIIPFGQKFKGVSMQRLGRLLPLSHLFRIGNR